MGISQHVRFLWLVLPMWLLSGCAKDVSAPAVPRLQLLDPLRFEVEVAYGKQRTDSLRVRNDGNALLIINRIEADSADAWLVASKADSLVQPGDTSAVARLVVSGQSLYETSPTGTDTTLLRIHSNDPEGPTQVWIEAVPLWARIMWQPDTLDFEVPEGGASSELLIIWNDGRATLEVYSIRCDASWVVVPDTSFNVAPDESVTIEIVADEPLGAGGIGASDSLVIASNDPGSPEVSVPVTAVIVRPPSAVIDSIVPNPAEQGVGDTVYFWGSAWDNDEDGQSVVSYVWRSDVDGELAEDEDFNLPADGLSLGAHLITFEVVDDEGDTASTVTALAIEAHNDPPDQPFDPSPDDGAEEVAIQPTLSWRCSDPDGDQLVYTVRGRELGSLRWAQWYAGPDTAFTLSAQLQVETWYEWEVEADDGYGGTTVGPIWSFKTRTNSPPDVPSDPTPADEATHVGLQPTFSWSCSDPDGDELTFAVEGRAQGGSWADWYSGSDTTFTSQSPLQEGTPYEWRVRAQDPFGEETQGPAWAFTTNAWPDEPSDPSPSDGEQGVALQPTFGWSCDDGDGDELAFVVEGREQGVTSWSEWYSGMDTSFAMVGHLQPDTWHEWRVTADDGYGGVTLGPVWVFETRPNSPPDEPSDPSPADGATGVALPPTLSWSCSDPDGHELAYTVEGREQGTLPWSEWYAGPDTTFVLDEELDLATWYQWKVTADDSQGGVTPGPGWTFETWSNLPPYEPSDPTPWDGEQDVGLQPAFAWSCGDPDGDWLAYSVWGGPQSGSWSEWYTGSDTTFWLGYLLQSGTWYDWQVTADDGNQGVTQGPVWSFETAWPSEWHWDDGTQEGAWGIYGPGPGGWAVTFHPDGALQVSMVRVWLGAAGLREKPFRIMVWDANWNVLYQSGHLLPQGSGWEEWEVDAAVYDSSFAIGVWQDSMDVSFADWYFGVDEDFSGAQWPEDTFNDETWVSLGGQWQKLSDAQFPQYEPCEMMFRCYAVPLADRARGSWLKPGTRAQNRRSDTPPSTSAVRIQRAR